jgi:hypothetical protein
MTDFASGVLAYQNFMAADLLGTVKAFGVFGLFACVPGYVAGWALNLLEFRRRSLLTQVALSTPLSIAFGPILAYLAGRLVSTTAMWILFGALWGGWVAILASRLWAGWGWGGSGRAGPGRACPAPTRWAGAASKYRVAGALMAGWMGLSLASLIDLQFGGRLYFSIVAYDHSARTAITAAIARSGMPPHNPYFFAGGYFPLRYHYFWMILCSLVQRIGGDAISARQAINAGTIWSGIGLMSLAPLYLRFFDPQGSARLPRRAAIGVALFAVTGLDILPNLLLAGGGNVLPEMEWWNNQVASWAGSMLWVPHHVAALVACLTGFLLVWRAPGARRRRDAAIAAAAAALAFATAAGTSIYVAFTFAVFLMAWTAIALAKRWRWEAALLALSGCLAVALTVPYLRDLRGPAAGGGFAHPAIRAFWIPDAALASLHVDAWKIKLADLALLPLNYFLELGFFFVVAILQWKDLRGRKGHYSRCDLAGLCMAGASVMVCTFLESGVIRNNDLGWRGFLPAQFVLLLWSVGVLDRWRLHSPGLRMTLAVLLLLGAGSTIYEVCLVRVFPPLSDFTGLPRYGWLSMDRQLGKRTYAERQVYEYLRTSTPKNAIVQHNPNADPEDIPAGLYADRQTAAETASCGAGFGGIVGLCAGVYGPLNDLFDKPGAVPPEDVDRLCRSLSIDILVAKDTDKVWADRRSWVWNRTPLAANGMVRAYACGAGAEARATVMMLRGAR